MEFYDLFYKWVPLYARLIILTLLYFTLLTANGIYTGITTEMASGLGIYLEPYTMAYNANYIGMGIGSMINIRIRERFSAKVLLLSGLMVMLVVNIVCATTNNPYLTVLACLFLGMVKVAASTEIYLVWLQIWSKKLDVSRLYPFVYFIALCGIYTTTWITSKFAYFYNWRYAYIVIIILILICVILAVVFVELHPLKRKVPLFQMDWIGILLLVCTLMLVNYVLVYGKVEDWGQSHRIRMAGLGALMLSLLFIRREIFFKRPVFPMGLFRLANFRLGLLYFFLLGIFVPPNIQLTFSAAGLHYENYRNTELTLYLIPGVIVAAVFCYYWFYHGYCDHLLLLIGFSVVTVYEIMMYFSFGNVFEMEGFWLPSLIKGMGLGILFIAIGIYITRGHTIKDVLTVVGVSFLVRSFLGTAVFTSLYSYLIYSQGIRHLNYLGSLVDGADALKLGGSDNGEIVAFLKTQASLGAAKELTGYIIIAGIGIAVFLLLKILTNWAKSCIDLK